MEKTIAKPEAPVVIEWDDVKIPLGLKQLRVLLGYSHHLAYKAQYVPLIRAIYDLNYSSVNETGYLYCFPPAERKAVWENNYLVRVFDSWDEVEFLQKFDDKMAEIIISMEDPRLVRQWEMLTECSPKEEQSYEDFIDRFPEAELSEEIYEKLLAHLRHLSEKIIYVDEDSDEYDNYDPSSYSLSEQFWNSKFALDEEVKISFARMTMNDLEFLDWLDLYRDVKDVSDIKDRETRVYVQNYCLNSQDPNKRLALASSLRTPADILKKLSADSDPDVANTAEKSLAKLS